MLVHEKAGKHDTSKWTNIIKKCYMMVYTPEIFIIAKKKKVHIEH